MKHTVMAVALVLLSPAAAADCGTLAIAERLLGRWEAQSAQSVVVETWRRASERTYEGLGETRREGRASAFETLRLVEMGGEVFYLAKVGHNALPIAFRLSSCEAGHLVFDNAAHDFPKRIEYRLLDVDGLTVRVSDGGERGFELNFRKVAGE